MSENQKQVRNKNEKIEKIFKSFFVLLSKNGYHKTTTNHIAKNAGISIGLLYKYFPRGKIDILMKYFETEKSAIFSMEEFQTLKQDTIDAVFTGFIRRMLDKQKENHGYNLAFRQALHAEPELLDAYRKSVICTSKFMAMNMIQAGVFKNVSLEKLTQGIVFIFNLIEAMTFQHSYIMNLFEKDEDLIQFLTKIIQRQIAIK